MSKSKNDPFGIGHWPKWKQIVVFLVALVLGIVVLESVKTALRDKPQETAGEVVQNPQRKATTYSETPSAFLGRYDETAKKMVPQLQTAGCILKQGSADKTITECKLQTGNALLSLDGVHDQLSGVWLMLDSTQLENASNLIRAGGLLLRVARGTTSGNYLQVSSDVFNASLQQEWRQVCQDDEAAASRLCVSANERGVFNITLNPL